MASSHIALAIAVICVLGSNFVVTKWGLDRLPPLALCSWRFLLSFFPACLFLPRPRGRLRLLVAFGVITGLGQFGLLCIAMRGLIGVGLASIVVQTQAFFNVALATLVLHEKLRVTQILGCFLAAAGLVLIVSTAGTFTTVLGMVLVLGAALSWACCNVLIRASGYEGDLVAFLVWSSLFAALPLIALSLLFDGTEALLRPAGSGQLDLWLIIAWQAFANTIFGYAVWNSLIRSYSLSRIGPLTLLVPIFAMTMSALLLGERLHALEGVAAAMIVAGVALPYLERMRTRHRST